MKILFFDGYCVLCNGLVDKLIRIDTENILKFAPLQGKTAENLLPLTYRPKDEVDTVLYFRDGKIYERSTAVLMSLQDIGGIWDYAKVLQFIPRFLRDAVYRLIVNIRYDVFGKRQTCRLPSEKEREHLLE